MRECKYFEGVIDAPRVALVVSNHPVEKFRHHTS
jgi:hypothetical protein